MVVRGRRRCCCRCGSIGAAATELLLLLLLHAQHTRARIGATAVEATEQRPLARPASLCCIRYRLQLLADGRASCLLVKLDQIEIDLLCKGLPSISTDV